MPNATVDFYFQFILRGHIQVVDEVSYLVCQDGTSFRLKELPPNAPQGLVSWQVIPNTDTSGIVHTLSVEGYSPDNNDGELREECLLAGRVVQLGKRGQFVQLKVVRSGEKTLKISFLSPDPRMKIGEIWQVRAIRQGHTLHLLEANSIQEAPHLPPHLQLASMQPTAKSVLEEQPRQSDSTKRLERRNGTRSPVSSSTSPSSTPTQNKAIQVPDRANPSTPPPTQAALAALVAETQSNDWKLGQPKQRSKNQWEWEAVSQTTQLQARVKVSGNGKKARVYQYPSTSNESEPLPVELQNRLVVTPLGAAMGIGASCFQILIGPYEIVLDCGTRPKGWEPLPALDYLSNPDLLLISHAHQDHLGAVPVFHSRYPGVRTICTVGTREIAHIMLTDCLKVQQLNEDSPQLFDETDLERTLFRLETQPTGIDFEPLPGLTVRFINAGHILGAACIYLRYEERGSSRGAPLTLLYTGDYNTTSSRTTTGLRLAELPEADILITESTYGADVHPARRTQETALLEAIAQIVQAGGNVLIPAFALGRAQEILLAIRTSNLFHNLRIPVYVDGLVRAVTDVFRDNLDLLPVSVQNLVKQNGIEPFFDPTGTPPIVAIGSPEERPLAMAKPSAIVASSGMLTGGASVYYAKTLLERENAAIFISGYTDEESPGRLLQSLETGETIELDGKKLTVRAQINRFNLSAHADKVGLGQVINKVNPKHLVLIHGSSDALHEIARSGDLRSKHFIHIPSVGERIEYGQAPEHLSSAQIRRIELPQDFEVEVQAEVEGAWLRIPETVVESDPRWQLLAASGLLKAKWEGIHLRLSPIAFQSLATQKAIEDALRSGEDCCAACQFFDSRSCQCEESSLFELQVDPTGKCTEFKRA